MRFIDHTTPPSNDKFHKSQGSTVKTYTEELEECSDVSPEPSDSDKKQKSPRKEFIDSGSTKWTLLKPWLSSKSSHKCWFCEALSTRAVMDVEHFRPKCGVTSQRKPVCYPQGHTLEKKPIDGYWWLAFDWKNYRLSCQRCNRVEKIFGKGNEFPLIDESTRCLVQTDDLTKEQPLLLDPCIETDCQLLAHPIGGEVLPAVDEQTDPIGYRRADYTIKTLGLNAFGAPEVRRGMQNTIISILNHFETSTPPQSFVDILRSYLTINTQYASFCRSIIGSYNYDWLDDLMDES